jgi:hypothetical protein
MSSQREITDLQRVFLQPANATHRRYEALRAYFVDKIPSKEAATRFGYTPGSFRVFCHDFRSDPTRPFFLADRTPRNTDTPKPQKKTSRLRDRVVELRKQNLSVYDISRAFAQDGETLSVPAVFGILREEGFAKLPRRRDDERPAGPKATLALLRT